MNSGAAHMNVDNVSEDWLDDDQVSDMAVGGNGPVTRNEGKPEAAIGKIVDGRVQGFFKDIALLEQPYAKDDKQSVAQIIGKATIVRFSQVEIG